MKKQQTCPKIRLQRVMKCCSGEPLKANKMIRSSKSTKTRGDSAGEYSSQNGEGEHRIETANIEEAESSLRQGGCLNNEEARALLGRLEYQRGNIEAAVRVFDGIDIVAVSSKIKISLARRASNKYHPSVYSSSILSMHTISLLFEAVFLKAKSLQDLGRFKEAAMSCNSILETVESALPYGVPANFGTDYKLQEIISKAVELLPELWKLGGFFHEATSAYRRALLNRWSLDTETTIQIQKEFAIFLLYCGSDASPPTLRSQLDGSFIPRNNTEEALLLLMILLRKSSLKKAEWDSTIIDHLTYALSVTGSLHALASQVEELLPSVMERQQRYYTLALCYFGEGDDMVALNLLKQILRASENPNCLKALLLASKICGNKRNYAEEGVFFARRALDNLQTGCDLMEGTANCLLGISLSAEARYPASDSERMAKQVEALRAFKMAEKSIKEDANLIYNLSLENAERRKLDAAHHYARLLLKLEARSNLKSWILLARILTAQKRYVDAEIVVNAALEQTGKWDQANLLRTKAKIQIKQGQLRNAIDTYTRLLAILQLRAKSLGAVFCKDGKLDRSLETETWHDLANVYTSIGQFNDAEECLLKSKSINFFSASRWHATGKLYEAKGLLKEALGAYQSALEIEATHVPSLVSTAVVLKQLGDQPLAVVRSFLTDALRTDKTNHDAWYHLGLLYKTEVGPSSHEAVECLQAAVVLWESAPVEPFR